MCEASKLLIQSEEQFSIFQNKDTFAKTLEIMHLSLGCVTQDF